MKKGSEILLSGMTGNDISFTANNNDAYNDDDTFQLVPIDTTIGLTLAFSSCFFIGISVIYKKLALKEIENRGCTRAVDGGFGYLRIPKWWLGIILMALGELTNFVAYIFAPAILVTPLGVFSIVWTATLSPYFLKEKLNTIGKLGCVLVLVGCVIVTLCGPKDREVSTLEELQSQLLHPGFLIYALIVVVVSIVLMSLVPRYGHKYVMLYITICSSFGSLSVMFCKGVGLALKQTIGGVNEFTNWATWVCLVSLIVSLLIETIYMQKALDLFSSSVFMSVNYVMFTSMVIIASSILYTELRELGWKNIVLTILGFIVNIAALYLLHLDKGESTGTTETNHQDMDPEQLNQASLKAKNIKQTVVQDIEAPRTSPLSNLTLNPNLFCDSKNNGKFVKLTNPDCSPDPPTHEIEQPPRSLTPGSNLSTHVVSNRSSKSSLCSPEEINNELTVHNINGIPSKSYEVPLLTQLQTSSHFSTSLPSSDHLPSSFSKPKEETTDLRRSRPTIEILSDVNESTRLV